MDKQDWLDKWKLNDIKFNQDEVNVRLEHYYSKLNLNKSDRIFVPLCGKSIDMLWLAQKGHPIVGVEFSPIACKAFFEENGLPYQVKTLDSFTAYYNDVITIYCGDYFALMPDLIGNSKAVYDRGGFVALPPDVQEQYIEHLVTLIPVGSKILMLTIEYDQQQIEGPPYSVSLDEIKQRCGSHFHIDQLEHEPGDVPEHLEEKGLQAADYAVYIITKIA